MSMNGDKVLEKRDKARAAAKAAATADGWKGFVNLDLDDRQRNEARGMIADPERVWDNIFQLVFSGYKMTLSYDANRSAFNLSMTCRVAGDANEGYTLSGRGGSEIAAAASFWYKHAVACEGRWPTGQSSGGQHFRPDQLD